MKIGLVRRSGASPKARPKKVDNPDEARQERQRLYLDKLKKVSPKIKKRVERIKAYDRRSYEQ